ncbi:MAG TPA: S8 family serine peptidase, partial [Longimicrobiales bacterium]|nr:S8 family serine peptidase [Longimicrobiales bacterium]
VDSLGNPAQFLNGRSSGRGPTADGRLKPELVALGRNVLGARSADRLTYTFNSGTSFSTPFITGGAAMFMQAWPNLTINAVRNALIQSGSRAQPNNDVGYGIPNISAAILFPEGFTVTISNGININGDLTTIQPGFTWIVPLVNQLMLPVRYTLQIATDPVFNNVVYSDTITNVTTLSLKRPLKAAPAYWYRVVATAAAGVTRTTPGVAPFEMPHWVRLTTLNSAVGARTDSLRPVFSWEALLAPPPSGPLSFELQVFNAQTGVQVLRMPNLTTATVQAPNPLAPNTAYRWRVITRSPAPGAPVDTTESAGTFVIQTNQAPPTTTLYQNFPNPFPRNDLGETSTHVWFDVNTPVAVELAVYDMRGRLVRNLIPNASGCGEVIVEPGQYGRASAEANPCITLTWDGRDARGELVPRGVYLLRLKAGSSVQVKKILYLPAQ